MNIGLWLARTAQLHPTRQALFLGKDCVSDYGAFHVQAMHLAGALAQAGVSPGDRVALFMKNVPDYLIAEYAVWYVGAAVVPINAKLHPREAAWIIDNARADLVFATAELAMELAQYCPADIVQVDGPRWDKMLNAAPVAAPVSRAPDDMAWLFYTSGTTGRPKGVIMTHRMLMTMSICYQSDCDLVTSRDCAIFAAPLSHGAGIYNMMHVREGARLVFPESAGFEPVEVLDLAQAFGSAHLFMAPTMVQRITQTAKAENRDGRGLRTIVYAGGPMYNTDIIDAVDHFGPIFAQIYGQGECPMGITALSREDVTDRTHPRWRERLGSVGRAQSVVEVRIADEKGQDVETGVTGEIVVRGDIVMAAYWENAKATQKTLTDGWLWTGDMGSMDEEGYVTLKDRSKDLIISGGTNIYPREVEEALREHADVIEAAVVGRPHPEWGEDVVAFVVKTPSASVTARDLDDHCLARIARFKRPKHYEFVESLPKNNYGKVLKTELRSKLAASS